MPLFAALLSVPLPEERYAALRLTPQQQKQQTHDALVAWMLEEAERQPVLLVWEDLHWAIRPPWSFSVCCSTSRPRPRC